MKKVNQFFTSLLVVCTFVTGLTGCQEKIDLNNVDTRMKVDFGLTLPVGHMLFTANDLLNGSQVKNLCVDENGLFHLVDTLRLPVKSFSNPDVSKYISKMEDQFKIKKKLLEIQLYPGSPSVLDENGNLQDFAKGIPLSIYFNKTINLKDVNQNRNQLRLDEAYVDIARFTSIISPVDMVLDWKWIEQVDIIFNHQFTIEGGNTVTVYKKGNPKGGYGKVIPLEVEQFIINLQKDSTQDPGWGNVLDTIGMQFCFTFIVPKEQSFHVSSQSAFSYIFESNSIEYSALYGWCNNIDPVRTREAIGLDSIFGGAGNMDSLLIKLAEPTIHLGVSHHMSVPTTITIDTLMTKNAEAERFATWNGSKGHTFLLSNVVNPYGPIQDSVWNNIVANQKEDSGHLDNLFDIRPDSLVLVFRAGVDTCKENYAYLQHRVTNQNTITSYAALDLPFLFNDGSKMKYSGKIADVQFNKLSIDSLLNEVKVVENGKANTLKMYMQFENSLPFNVETIIHFLNQDSIDMHLNLLEGQNDNRITLSAPKMEILDGARYGRVTEPSLTTVIVDVNQQQLDTLIKAKHLEILTRMGDNPMPCSIDATSSLRFGIGLAANVDAIINPTKK